MYHINQLKLYSDRILNININWEDVTTHTHTDIKSKQTEQQNDFTLNFTVYSPFNQRKFKIPINNWMFDSNTRSRLHTKYICRIEVCTLCSRPGIYIVRVYVAYCACNDHHPSYKLTDTHTEKQTSKQTLYTYAEIFDTHLMTVFFVIFKL